MDIKREREQLHILETLLLNDKEEAALNLAEKIEKEFPDSFQIKFVRAKILIKLKKNISAEEALKELEKTHSDNLNLLKVISDFYEGLDKKEKSLDYLNKINFIDPFNTDIKNKIKNIKIQIERKKTSVADTLPELKLQELMEEKKTVKQIVIDLEREQEKQIINNESDKEPEDEFNTMSAADIYINQGLYKDALIILENISRTEKDSAVLNKIQNLKDKIIIAKKIEKLTSFMDMIKKKGVNIV